MIDDNDKILFKEFFSVPFPDKTKIKFNMNDADPTKSAYDALMNEDNEQWIRMNAHRSKGSRSNKLDSADYLLAFAQYPYYGPKYYIFGGYYKVTKKEPEVEEGTGYDLELMPEYRQYIKRLIIKLDNPVGRNLYCRLYNNIDAGELNPEIYELAPNTKLGPFPGYSNVCIKWKELHRIVESEEPEWENALSGVKGVYCITDCSNGKLYIGKASGNEDGLWQRWKNYGNSKNPSGGNLELKQIDSEHIKNNFQYSIIEIFDTKTNLYHILERESYWKKVLLTKYPFGYNHN